MFRRMSGAIGAMNDAGNRWTKESRIWIPEVEASHRIRVDKLAQELDLRETGAADGRQKQPARGDRTLNETQLTVCGRVFSGIVLLNQFLAERLGQALAEARMRAPQPIDEKDFRSRIGHAVDGVFAERVGEITQLREHELDMRRNLRYFVAKNRLKTAASYKDSVWLTIAVIFGLFVVESVANGLLFQDVVATGLAGGAVIAGLISVINIALGLAAGFYGWRYLGHVAIVKRVMGGLVLLACHACAAFWNLFVAHFREVAEAAVRSDDYAFDINLLAQQTSEHIGRTGWLGLDSIIALALLGLGIIIHCVATKEGWDDFSDRYPDYRRVDLRAKTARADYDDALVELRQDARDAANDVIEEAEAAGRAAGAGLQLIANTENLAAQREKEVRDSEDEWVAGGTQLLKTYRDENILVRGDEAPPPAYFATYPAAVDYRQRRYDGTGHDSTVDTHAQAAAASLEALADLRVAAEACVAANVETLGRLREEVNRVLDTLTARVDAARDVANQAAAANVADAGGAAR